MKTNNTSLVTVSESSAKLILMMYDLCDLNAEILSGIDNNNEATVNEEAKAAFATYYSFLEAQLMKAIKKIP